MNYNLVLYIGLSLIVGGFLLFLFCEMKEREADRKLAENQRFIDALVRTQLLQKIREDIRKWLKKKNRIILVFQLV